MGPLPGRADFWNIGYPLLGALVYLTALLAAWSIYTSLRRRVGLWGQGKRDGAARPWGPRLNAALRLFSRDVLAHRRFLRGGEAYAGIMHFCLFWGISLLFIATVFAALEHNWHEYLSAAAGFEFPTSHIRVQTGFVWDVFGGGLATIGVAMALWRRYVIRPPRLNTVLDDGVVLSLIALLIVTGFMIEGLRIGATQFHGEGQWEALSLRLQHPHPPLWTSPIGYLFAVAFRGVGMSQQGMKLAHTALWWGHAGLVAVGFVYAGLRFSKVSHVFLSPLNAFLRSPRPGGALEAVPDLEKAERFGASDVKDLTWKQLLSLDACTNCGRCQDRCPAYLTGKALSPRRLVQDMRAYMEARAAPPSQNDGGAPAGGAGLVEAVTEEALWDCTTCRACVEACPVFIEHIDLIVEPRRYLVMDRGSLPDGARQALQSLEQRGHPWRGTTFNRTGWMKGLDVPLMADKKKADVLFWVGCTAALDARTQSVARAMARVLKGANVDFAVLGEEETCTGDPARRLGNEYLFQMLAQQNIQTFQRYGVKRIVTICPHCYNTLKNEYPDFGGRYEVQHSLELVGQLLREGRLKLRAESESIAYHDSCYLGRHNGLYRPPRELAALVPGLQLVEPRPGGREGLCCGAGGGRMWVEEPAEKRVSHLRARQLLATGAPVIGASCPFCIQMLTEGVEAERGQGTQQVRDLVEMVADRL